MPSVNLVWLAREAPVPVHSRDGALERNGRFWTAPATLSPSHSIHLLGLPSRAANAFGAAAILTLEDAAGWSERDLRSLPQIGPAAVDAIRHALALAGLALQSSGRRRPPRKVRRVKAGT